MRDNDINEEWYWWHKRNFQISKKKINELQNEILSIEEFSGMNWFVDCSGPVLDKMLQAGGKLLPTKYYPAVINEHELASYSIWVTGEYSYSREFRDSEIAEKIYIEKSIVMFKSREQIDNVILSIEKEFNDTITNVCEGKMLSKQELLDNPLLFAKILNTINEELFEKKRYWEIPKLKLPYWYLFDGQEYITNVIEKYEDTEYEETIYAACEAAERISAREKIRVCQLGKNYIAWRS